MPLRATPTIAEIVRQQIAGGEIVERRNHQAMGQIAGGAEDDEGAGGRACDRSAFAWPL